MIVGPPNNIGAERTYSQEDFDHELALREAALREAAAQFVEANTPYLPGVGSVGKPMADHIRAALPSSTDILAQREPIIRCGDCGGTQMWEQTAEGYKTIHSCIGAPEYE